MTSGFFFESDIIVSHICCGVVPNSITVVALSVCQTFSAPKCLFAAEGGDVFLNIFGFISFEFRLIFLGETVSVAGSDLC